MAEVFAWPPVGLTGWEIAEIEPQSRSVGIVLGRPRTSSAQVARRQAIAVIAGRGKDAAGAGYLRMLRRLWLGKPRLTRVSCLSSLWHLSRAGQDLSNGILEWTEGAVDLLWTEGGTDLIYGWGAYQTHATPVTDSGWHGLTVTGLPPSTIVARPSEPIRVTDGTDTEAAYVLSVSRSDGSGTAVIRTDKATAFTIPGLVSIGHREDVVFEALDLGRAIQPVRGADWSFTWSFREVFEDEFAGGWSEVDPWR